MPFILKQRLSGPVLYSLKEDGRSQIQVTPVVLGNSPIPSARLCSFMQRCQHTKASPYGPGKCYKLAGLLLRVP